MMSSENTFLTFSSLLQWIRNKSRGPLHKRMSLSGWQPLLTSLWCVTQLSICVWLQFGVPWWWLSQVILVVSHLISDDKPSCSPRLLIWLYHPHTHPSNHLHYNCTNTHTWIPGPGVFSCWVAKLNNTPNSWHVFLVLPTYRPNTMRGFRFCWWGV